VSRLAAMPRSLRTWAANRRVQLALSLRVALAAVLSFVLSRLFDLPLALWVVLTAIILTQVSFGRSLKATIDYCVGTLGGAAYAGLIAALVPHSTQLAFAAILATAVAPLAFLAAMNPSFSAAPFTAVMVILTPTIMQVSPIASASYRVLEVALGGMCALVVSFLVFPTRAHALAIEAAANILHLMAQLLPKLFAGFGEQLETSAIRPIQDSIGRMFGRLDTIAAEVKHERVSRLSPPPATEPLLRTLLRLRHDFVMIGRAAVMPLPAALQLRLRRPIAEVSDTATAYLRESGEALLARRPPPRLFAFEVALEAYAAEISAIRREGLTRDLEVDIVERLFALGFALEQMRQNCRDLARCVAECSSSERPLSKTYLPIPPA
jgi:uncharacterized membrane protein YccC